MHLDYLQNVPLGINELLLEIYLESIAMRISWENTPIQFLKSIKNTGAVIEETTIMLQGTEINLNRRPAISRCFSSSRL
jgi:hypothetical protein